MTGSPASATDCPSVLVIDRSAVGVPTVKLAEAELLAGVGSATPPVVVMLAVLLTAPLAAGSMVATTVKVTGRLSSKVTAALMLPVPLAGQLEPRLPLLHVHTTLVSLASKLSVTVPAATPGPLLLATSVYVTIVPAMCAPVSDLAMPKFACGVNVVLSCAKLFAWFVSATLLGAVMPAELISVPVAAGSSVPTMTNVAVPLTSRSTLALMLPAPLAGQLEPLEAAHVHVASLRADGTVSVTVAPVTADGPRLEAVMV